MAGNVVSAWRGTVHSPGAGCHGRLQRIPAEVSRRTRLTGGSDGGSLRSMPAAGVAPSAGDEPPKKLMLKVRGRMILLDEGAIEWIDAAGNYVRFNAGGAIHQVRGTIKDVEQALEPSRFLRVHRSTIVNIDAVAEFIRGRYGDLTAVLKSGKRLAVGRRYRRLLVAALQAIAGVVLA
jgi:two-component system, LytTR family, response regulator